MVTGGRNLIFPGLSAHPTLWSSPLQQPAGAQSPSLPTANLFASFSCQASQEHWPCYQSLRSPHECRRRESWIARSWLVQGWVPHHATHPPAPAAGHQDEPQENPAAGARVQHLESSHPSGGTAQLVRGQGLREGEGPGWGRAPGRGRGLHEGRGQGSCVLRQPVTRTGSASSPFLAPARTVCFLLGFVPSLYPTSVFHTFSSDPHHLPGQGLISNERVERLA